MKNYIFLILLLGIVSCNSPKSKYAEIIAEAVETTKGGTRFDLNFEVLEIEEVGRITVADSIKHITDVFNEQKEKQLSRVESSLMRSIESLGKEKKSRLSLQTIIQMHEKNITKMNHMVDSLKATQPDIAPYDMMDSNTVLAVIVRCKYSIDEPLTKTRVTEEFEFVVSEDAKTFYDKRRILISLYEKMTVFRIFQKFR